MLQRLKRRWCMYLIVFAPALYLEYATLSNAYANAFRTFIAFAWILFAIAPAFIIARKAWPEPNPKPTRPKRTWRHECVLAACAIVPALVIKFATLPKGTPPDIFAAIIICAAMISLTINDLLDARHETPQAD